MAFHTSPSQVRSNVRRRRWFGAATLIFSLLAFSSVTVAQTPGSEDGESVNGGDSVADSLFLFTPVHPLIDSAGIQVDLPSAIGGSLFFSSSGYGAGLFYEGSLTPSLSGFVDLKISGVRSGDELQVYNNDPESIHYQSFFVPGKVNRLWQAPLMVGVKKELFRDVFFDNFRPFVSVGLGGSTVIATPYDQSFFKAFGSATLSLVPGGFVGVGAEVTEWRPGIGFSARLYYLPAGDGIESIEGEPITNLGGLSLALTVPF